MTHPLQVITHLQYDITHPGPTRGPTRSTPGQLKPHQAPNRPHTGSRHAQEQLDMRDDLKRLLIVTITLLKQNTASCLGLWHHHDSNWFLLLFIYFVAEIGVLFFLPHFITFSASCHRSQVVASNLLPFFLSRTTTVQCAYLLYFLWSAGFRDLNHVVHSEAGLMGL